MRKLSVVLGFLLISYLGFGFYLNLTPEQRKDLANDWLEAAKAFDMVGKSKKAIVSYKHTFNLYPFGEAAQEAQKILKEKYDIKVSYTKESFEKYNLKLASKYEKENYKYAVNAYLMAYDVSGNPEYLYKASLVLYNNGMKNKAKELANEAISKGVDSTKVDPNILK
ncbi:MAG: hypothetical protein ACP5QP_08030 [Brevinematia bacterium]